MIIHRYALSGMPRCGATGKVRMSTWGNNVTCSDCIRLDPGNPLLCPWCHETRSPSHRCPR